MKIILSIMFLMTITGLVFAADSEQDSSEDDYTFKPLLLDSQDSAGTVLGIQYGLKKKWAFTGKDDDDDPINFPHVEDGSEFEPDHWFVKAELSGIWTTDKNTNPKAFSKADLNLAYSIFRTEKSIEIGGQWALEGDQNFDNTQTVVAAKVEGQYGFTSDATTYLGGILAYGEVDASKDDGRKALTNDTTFNRFEAELHLNIGIEQGNRKYSPKAIGLNYRYFGEKDAPDSIKAADQDVFDLATISIKFKQGVYLAYSVGKLPFDRESDKIFEIGFSQNFF